MKGPETTNWQQRMKSIDERDLYLLQQKQWTDCCFIVGRERKRFECHRLFLSKTSPFFEALFNQKRYNEKIHKCEIPLPDIEPEGFAEVLNYIYGNYYSEVPDMPEEQLAKLWQAGVKLQLPASFVKKIRDILSPPVEFHDRALVKPRWKCYCFGYQSGSYTDRYHRPTREGIKWQQAQRTKHCRDSYIKRKGRWADTRIVVGPKKDSNKRENIFQCHSLLLAATSPVLARMVYKNMKPGLRILKLHAIKPKVFSALLSYVYFGYVYCKKGRMAWDVLAAGKRFKFPDRMLEMMRARIWAAIFPKRVWSTLHRAQMHGEPMLLQTAWQVVQLRTHLCVTRLKSFTAISEAVLVRLVQLPELNISEGFLLLGCVAWGRAEVNRRGGNPEDPQAVREALVKVLPHVRILSLSLQQLDKALERSELFTQDEIEKLLMIAGTRKVSVSVPDGLCSIRTPRSRYRPDQFHVYGCKRDMLSLEQKALNAEGRYHYSTFALLSCASRLIRSPPESRLLQVGVLLPSQERPAGCTEDWYEESLTVQLFDKRRRKTLAKQHFSGQVRYNDTLEVQFDKPAVLFRRKHSTTTQVTLHRSGVYPCRPEGKGTKRRRPHDNDHGPYGEVTHAQHLHRDNKKYSYIFQQAYEVRSIDDLAPYYLPPGKKRKIQYKKDNENCSVM